MIKPGETRGLQLRSLIKPNGELELSLAEIVVPPPQPEEVVVRVEAAPINPSDVQVLLASADLSTLRRSCSVKNEAVLNADIPPAALSLITGRIGLAVTVGIDLVNTVRSQEQENILRNLGARYICNSTTPEFENELVNAIAATNARIVFDAIGGGKLVGQILYAMHVAASRSLSTYSRYGAMVHKQVYSYGNLDPAPTVIDRTFGMAWGIAGWSMPSFVETIGPAETAKPKARVAAELTTTVAS